MEIEINSNANENENANEDENGDAFASESTPNEVIQNRLKSFGHLEESIN